MQITAEWRTRRRMTLGMSNGYTTKDNFKFISLSQLSGLFTAVLACLKALRNSMDHFEQRLQKTTNSKSPINNSYNVKDY